MTKLRRILILEENTDHLELLTNILENNFAPIDTHTVETVEDCLEFLEQAEYDLIMTGCFIHKTCITERLSQIVERSFGAPIIVITGSGDENIAAKVIKLGASEYLVKTRKTLEELPCLVAKYFKKPHRRIHPARKDSKIAADRLLREVDRLTQKVRLISASEVAGKLPIEMPSIDSLFSQIQRLRDLASKLLQK